MFPSSTSDKIKSFLLNLLTKYIGWIIVLAVIIVWWFFPAMTEDMAKIVFFWAPAIVLILSFIIAATRNNFKAKRDREQGLTQYDIVITVTELYLADLLIYGGTLAILLAAYFLNPGGVDAVDLVQAVIYYIFANWLKQVFYRKIIK